MTDVDAAWTLELEDPDATRALGRALGGALAPGLVVALSGDLGAGKTALAKAAIAAQGAAEEDDVASPTFVLAVEHPGRVPTLHVDAYRLDGPEAFEALGFGPLERLERATLVEWPERVAAALPDDRLDVALDHADPGRRATLRARGPRARAALAAARAAHAAAAGAAPADRAAGGALPLRRVTRAEHRVVPWRNGQGTTREVAAWPEGAGAAGGFAWRLSLAEVTRAGPFSTFPGVDRTLLLVAGDGMALELVEAPGAAPRAARLDRPFEPFRFRGEWATTCALLGGPVTDLNVMTDRARATHAAEVLRAPAVAVLPAGATGLLHALAGGVAVEAPAARAALEAGETLVVGPAPADAPLGLTPAGPGAAALWVVVTPAGQAGETGAPAAR